MGRLFWSVLSAVGVAAISMMIFGSGVASAWDPLVGKTYDDAATTISGWNGTPVINTVTGSQLEKGNCIVTSWHKSIFLDASGKNTRPHDYLISLDCNNHLAAPGHPGNSVMSPEGVKAKHDQEAAVAISKNPAYCQKDDATMQRCKGVCQRTGLCQI
jgi:hypothetical protein